MHVSDNKKRRGNERELFNFKCKRKLRNAWLSVIFSLSLSSSLKAKEFSAHKHHSSIPPYSHLSYEDTRRWCYLKYWEMERAMHWALSPFNLWVIMAFTNIRNPLISNHRALFKSRCITAATLWIAVPVQYCCSHCLIFPFTYDILCPSDTSTFK